MKEGFLFASWDYNLFQTQRPTSCNFKLKQCSSTTYLKSYVLEPAGQLKLSRKEYFQPLNRALTENAKWQFLLQLKSPTGRSLSVDRGKPINQWPTLWDPYRGSSEGQTIFQNLYKTLDNINLSRATMSSGTKVPFRIQIF